MPLTKVIRVKSTLPVTYHGRRRYFRGQEFDYDLPEGESLPGFLVPVEEPAPEPEPEPEPEVRGKRRK